MWRFGGFGGSAATGSTITPRAGFDARHGTVQLQTAPLEGTLHLDRCQTRSLLVRRAMLAWCRDGASARPSRRLAATASKNAMVER